MGDRAQGLGGLLDDLVSLYTVFAGDEADTAAALLVARVPQQWLGAGFRPHSSSVLGG